MIEMKYEDLSTEAFTMALTRLSRSPFTGKTAYAIKKMVDAVNKARNQVSEEYREEIMGTYAKKGEDGKIAYDENGMAVMDDARQDEFTKAQLDFGKRMAKIDRFKLPLAWLLDAKGMTAMDFAALDPVVDEEAQMGMNNVFSIPPGA